MLNMTFDPPFFLVPCVDLKLCWYILRLSRPARQEPLLLPTRHKITNVGDCMTMHHVTIVSPPGFCLHPSSWV